MSISEGVLKEFKERMHFENEEDPNLIRILTASAKELKRVCGDYDLDVDEEFKELVFERARYAYNDALEYFSKNFLTEINSLSMAKALEETAGDPIATIQVQAETELRRLAEPSGSLGERKI